MFEEEINDYKIISDGYINRDGFLFFCGSFAANIFDVLFVKNTQGKTISHHRYPESSRTLDEHIQFINENKIEKVLAVTDDVEFLRKIQGVKHLSIILFKGDEGVDYSPIYDMPELISFGIDRYDLELMTNPVDYSKINGLLEIGVSAKEDINYEKIETLKSLSVTDWKKKDLKGLFVSKQLDSLYLLQCSMHSLNGIEISECMQCVYLHYNRALRDISALRNVKKTLKALRIENCPKIEDFSVLEELENLELLELTGKNTLESLSFIKKLKNLKTFTFSMNVLDGDLTPCLDLSYVYSEKNRKHYNLKDKDLPKGNYVRGNEDIELWRRME